MKTKTCNILRCKDATTDTFIVNYVFRIRDSECASLQFLLSFLEQKGSFYENPSQMVKAFNALYGSSVQSSIETLGQLAIISLKLVTPHKNFIKEDMFKNALELLKSFVEDVSENRYEYSMLDAHKKEVIKQAKELENRAIEMGNFQVFSQIQPSAKISRPSYRKISDIKKVNLEALKKLHRKMLKGNRFIFAESLSPVSKTKKIIQSVFKSTSKCISNQFELFDSPSVKISERSQSDIPQSAAYVLYKYSKNICPQSISLFNDALNNELFETIREKHGYCYFIYSKLLMAHNLLLIRAHTSLKKLDKTVDLINVTVENFELNEESFNSAKLKRINHLETILENPSDLNTFMLKRKLLKLNEDVHEEIKATSEADLKLVSEVKASLKLISIVKVRGVNGNEN